MSNTSEVYQIITERIIAQLQKGVVPWRKSWGSQGLPANLISKTPYRGINSLLLSFTSYKSPWYLTFKQCSQFGATVKKGESGWPVIYWKVSYKTPSGKFVPASALTPAQRLTFEKSFLLRFYKVWNVDQCDNLEQHLPAPVAQTHTPLPTAESIVANFPSCPPINHQGNEAFYHPVHDFVQMPKPDDFRSPQAYYATLFHELIHSTGHQSRLSRDSVTDRKVTFASVEYSKEELIAELGSCFLLNHAGFADDVQISNAAAYINSWIKKLQDDPKLIIQASSKAQQAADFILNIKAESDFSDSALPLAA